MADIPTDLTITSLTAENSVAVQRLVRECAPLTLHTPYSYWVMLTYGGNLSRAVWQDGRLAACALVVPAGTTVAFVWQLGVAPQYRGKGLAGAVLRAVWDERAEWVAHLETTIAPDNHKSYASFAGLARARGLELREVAAIGVAGPDGSMVERETHYRLG